MELLLIIIVATLLIIAAEVLYSLSTREQCPKCKKKLRVTIIDEALCANCDKGRAE
jgi:hypothetical protein